MPSGSVISGHKCDGRLHKSSVALKHRAVTSIPQLASGVREHAHAQGINQAVFASHWCPILSIVSVGMLEVPHLDSVGPELCLLRNCSSPCIIHLQGSDFINFGSNVGVTISSEVHSYQYELRH